MLAGGFDVQAYQPGIGDLRSFPWRCGVQSGTSSINYHSLEFGMDPVWPQFPQYMASQRERGAFALCVDQSHEVKMRVRQC